MLPAIRPTASPSSRPTNSHAPTVNPTKSHHPSHVPSLLPTSFPSSVLNSTSKGLFRQDFVMDAVDSQFFNETQNETLARILESYTSDFAPDQGVLAEIVTVCLIDDQSGSIDKQNRTINSVDYSCQYTSRVKNVTSFADLFLTYINANTAKLTFDMQAQLLPVNASLQATVRKILSPAPTVSAQPSSEPTIVPTVSSPPSLFPSKSPSAGPSRPHLPTTPPMFLRLTPAPSKAPTHTSNHLPHAGAIVAIVVLMGLIFLVGLFFYYRYWKKKREQSIRPPRAETTVAAAPTTSQQSSGGRSSRRLRAISRTNLLWNSNNTNGSQAPTAVTVSSAVALTDDRTDQNIVLSPTESILSNQSLLSEGESGLGDDSGDELDGTNNLQDEFDQYKDQNLEQLRADVEGNLSGFEGIMSAAVTNALMEDEDTNVETQELLWGCKPNADGTVIEASALFEVSDWLTRNESAEGERKRAFMQEILNKMVTSVRHGVIVAEDASRTIHESAAILGLQLAEELPTTTVIISGMRKTTTADDMIKALQEFGDIDVAAVASGRRGFGILRFRRRKSVDRALRRYKSGEIVILDVSIQMKVLMPSGAVESR